MFFCSVIEDRRGGGYRRHQRQPSPSREDDAEDIEVRLRGLIIKIGDKVNKNEAWSIGSEENICIYACNRS